MSSLEAKLFLRTTIDYPYYMYQIALDNSEVQKL